VSPEDGAGYMQGSPAENLQYIEREIDAACKIASADGAKRQVTITAVSKNKQNQGSGSFFQYD